MTDRERRLMLARIRIAIARDLLDQAADYCVTGPETDACDRLAAGATRLAKRLGRLLREAGETEAKS